MPARIALTEKILRHKLRLGLGWKQIAAVLGTSSPIIYTSAPLGQFPLSPDEAAKAEALLTTCPVRGEGSVMPPTDPMIYRLYELIQNYGMTWKELINEEFGNGIMSAIDFNM